MILKKKKLRSLICSNHFHNKICVKSSSKRSDFLAICNIILLSDLTKESKNSEFQNHSRKYYQKFLWLHYYLKGLAVLVKEKDKEKTETIKKMTQQEFEKKIFCCKYAADLHYFLINV